MVSVASLGTTERIAARILFKVLLAGCESAARYSSTLFGLLPLLVAGLRLLDFERFMWAMLRELWLPVHESVREADYCNRTAGEDRVRGPAEPSVCENNQKLLVRERCGSRPGWSR